MKKLWPYENVVVLAVLAGAVWYWRLPRTWTTLGWAVGAFAIHTARSHAGRLAEDAGKPIDWTMTFAGWLGGAGAMLASQADQKVLLGVPLGIWVAHVVYRFYYREVRPVLTSWSREDD